MRRASETQPQRQRIVDNEDITEVKSMAKAIDGWLTDREIEFLYRTARDCVSEGMIVEIGSWKGKSTVVLGKGSMAGPRTPVYAIDPHVGTPHQAKLLGARSSFNEFQSNIKKMGVSDFIVPIVKRSEEAGQTWNKPISFLWIDGDHSYNAAMSDFELFGRWVLEGGVVAFHDSTQEGVLKVVREVFRARDFVKIGLADTISYATKSARSSKTGRDRFVLFLIANHDFFRGIYGARRLKRPFKWAISRF